MLPRTGYPDDDAAVAGRDGEGSGVVVLRDADDPRMTKDDDAASETGEHVPDEGSTPPSTQKISLKDRR